MELKTDENKAIFAEFDKSLADRLKEDVRKYDGDKPTFEHWADFANNPDFVEEFKNVVDNPDIPEADDYTPEVLEDTYVNMELAMDRGGDAPEFARVRKKKT